METQRRILVVECTDSVCVGLPMDGNKVGSASKQDAEEEGAKEDRATGRSMLFLPVVGGAVSSSGACTSNSFEALLLLLLLLLHMPQATSRRINSCATASSCALNVSMSAQERWRLYRNEVRGMPMGTRRTKPPKKLLVLLPLLVSLLVERCDGCVCVRVEKFTFFVRKKWLWLLLLLLFLSYLQRQGCGCDDR